MAKETLVYNLERQLERKLAVHESDLLNAHLSFVLEKNKNINLTRIGSYDEGTLLHIEDSLTAFREVMKAPDGELADIGSGAGYPGIPLAIVSGRKTTLIESIGKKAAILEEFIKSYNLVNSIKVEGKRTEEVAYTQKNKFSVITARAVSELPALVELAAPLLAPGGLFIAYKGSPSSEEIERGATAAKKVGLTEEESRTFCLSDNFTERTIIVYRKTHEADIILPRRPGIAQKRPLA